MPDSSTHHDATSHDVASATTTRTTEESGGPRASGGALLLAGLVGAAGLIHVAMIPAHANSGLLEPIGFAVAAWAQLTLAALLFSGRAKQRTYDAVLVINAVLLGLWLWSRISGLPLVNDPVTAEPIGAIDGITAALELAAVLVAPAVRRSSAHSGTTRTWAPVIGAMAALGLATAVIVSPETAAHDHTTNGPTSLSAMGSGAATGSDGHAHGSSAAGTSSAQAQMQAVDQARCDLKLNPKSYWNEARYLGVDIYTGGELSMQADGADSIAAAVAAPDPLEGRGSPELDQLVRLTDASGTSEGAAGALVSELSTSDDSTYGAWLSWMRSANSIGHSHTTGSGDDSGGHGGHVGPQPWKAMVDESECQQLERELDRARAVALKYPTTADAEAGGWHLVTGFVPGIAAHYIKIPSVDGTFDIDAPEMLLYDGTEPDSSIVGLSYYIVHAADSEPTQGFTGANDHFHRHVGLCFSDTGVVIGDSSLSEEECAARGGRKPTSSAGWMNHVWIVPGCESPWGVFSAASPLLDRDLTDASASDGGGCKGSGVADRYDLSPGDSNSLVSAPTPLMDSNK